MPNARGLATAALFGVIISIVMGEFLPPPTGDLLVVVEATLLGLSFILIGPGGATYTAAVAGILLNIQFLSYGAYPLLLALLYGVLTDGFSIALGVRRAVGISSVRLAAALTLSSAITGPVAYYLTLPYVPNAPSDISFYELIIVIGVVSGAAAGFLAARLWERNLKSRFSSVQPRP